MRREFRQHIVPGVLIAAMAIVAFWEVMAYRSARPARISGNVEKRLAGFCPVPEGWTVRLRGDREKDHPSVENIFTYELHGSGRQRIPVITRLVLGYNMPDCMRLRGYAVEEVGRGPYFAQGYVGRTISKADRSEVRGKREEGSAKPSQSDTPTPLADPVQVWRLTSKLGETEIWATAMLRASDFAWTGVDVQTMAFPRIVGGLDPSWVPRGVSRDGLRHPVREIRNFMINKWNSSRSDLLTFLRLKSGAWVNEDLLTLVSSSTGRAVREGEEEAAIREVVAALQAMQAELARTAE